MNSSDWIQIVPSIIGFVGGAVVSFVFFRFEQVSDLKGLRESIHFATEETKQNTANAKDISEKLSSVAAILEKIKTMDDVTKSIDRKEDLTSIQNTVESIQRTLSGAVDSILKEVKEQQESLAKSLEKSYEEQSKKAIKAIRESLGKELNRALPASPERDVLLQNSVMLITQAMTALGKFQQINFEQQTISALGNVETRIAEKINELEVEVLDLKKNTENLLAIPAPSSQQSNLPNR